MDSLGYLELGVSAFDSGDHGSALASFARGCEMAVAAEARAALSSSEPPPPAIAGCLWQNRAAALIELRRFGDAGRVAAHARSLGPSGGATCVIGARAALQQGMVGPAVELFAKALEVSCGASEEAGHAAFARPRWSREDVARLGYTGLKECDRLQRLCAAAKHNISVGEPELALEDAAVALRLAQVSPRVIRLVVNALAGCGHIQRAIEMCEAALPLQWIPPAREKRALLKGAQMARTARAAAAIRTAKRARSGGAAGPASAGGADSADSADGADGVVDEESLGTMATLATWHQVRLVLASGRDAVALPATAAAMPMLVYTHLESLGLLYARLLRRSSLDGCALAMAVLRGILGTAEEPSAEHEHFHQARLELRTVRRVGTLVNRAKVHLGEGEWEQAARLTSIAIAAVGNTPSVEMHWQRSRVAEHEGRSDDAVANLREARKTALPDGKISDTTCHFLKVFFFFYLTLCFLFPSQTGRSTLSSASCAASRGWRVRRRRRRTVRRRRFERAPKATTRRCRSTSPPRPRPPRRTPSSPLRPGPHPSTPSS